MRNAVNDTQPSFRLHHIPLLGGAFNSSNFFPPPLRLIRPFITYILLQSSTIKIVPDLRLRYTHTRHASYTHRSRGNLSKSKYRRRNREERFSRYSRLARIRIYPPPHLYACVCRLRGPRHAYVRVCVHAGTRARARLFPIFWCICTYVRIHECSQAARAFSAVAQRGAFRASSSWMHLT